MFHERINHDMQTTFVTLSTAAKMFPSRNGERMHVRSIRRRIINGVHGVKLRAVRNGGQWFTTPQWIAEFLDDCTRQTVKEAPTCQDTSAAHALALEALGARYGIHVPAKTERQQEAVASSSPEGGTLPDGRMPADGEAPGALPSLLRRRISPRQSRQGYMGRAGS